MDFVVKEFEKAYANGQKVDEVRKFVNRYYIQGGDHARLSQEKNNQANQARRARIIEKKLQVLEYLLR
jgi:hypothetical protein